MKLIIATHNQGKVREFQRILAPLGIQAVSSVEAGVDAEVEETGTTFLQNAQLKARAVMERCGLPCIADDSGLCVDALGGAPGVYSARYAGEGATDDMRIDKLLRALEGIPDSLRGARFVAAICCCFPDGDSITAQGVCEGQIGHEKRGDGGFGYDPVFLTQHGSFAEITPEQKDAVSHRGKALREFCRLLEERQKDREQNRTGE